MHFTTPFVLTVGFIAGASFSGTSTGFGVEDALAVAAFYVGSALLGGAIFWLRRSCGTGEMCKLNLPPGPPAAWKVRAAA